MTKSHHDLSQIISKIKYSQEDDSEEEAMNEISRLNLSHDILYDFISLQKPISKQKQTKS